MTDLTIVVPVYNVQDYLDDCVGSIISQTKKDGFEVIFVNDGSTDNSYEKLTQLCSNDARFRVFSKENGGLSSARNLGIQKARGKYISFLDSDDWIDKDYVGNILRAVTSYSADLYYFDRVFVREDSVERTQLPDFQGTLNDLDILNEINISACNKVYHCRLFKGNLFPLGVIYEDFPFMFTVYSNVGAICKIPGHLYYVRQTNPNSITSSIHPQERDMLNNLESVEQYLKDNGNAKLYAVYKNFELSTIISWSMKQLRGKEVKNVNLVDFSKYSLSQAEGRFYKLLLFLLKQRWYPVIYLMLYIDRLRKS